MVANNSPFRQASPVVGGQQLQPFVVAHAQPTPPRAVRFPAGMASGSLGYNTVPVDADVQGTPILVNHIPGWLRRGV